jgi:hypothetical protein
LTFSVSLWLAVFFKVFSVLSVLSVVNLQGPWLILNQNRSPRPAARIMAFMMQED